jgi:hypothetical protein
MEHIGPKCLGKVIASDDKKEFKNKRQVTKI